MEKLDHRFNINEEEKKLIEDIEAFIGQYEIGGNLGLVKLDPAVCESLNIDRGVMAEMSSEDIYHNAYLIQAYISKITNQKNRNKIILFQIEAAYKDAINHYLPSMTFPDYTKYEAKEQMICEKNDMAFKLRELMRKMQSVLMLYDDLIEPLKKMSDTLNNVGRTK
jgi:hypothetical protein